MSGTMRIGNSIAPSALIDGLRVGHKASYTHYPPGAASVPVSLDQGVDIESRNWRAPEDRCHASDDDVLDAVRFKQFENSLEALRRHPIVEPA